MAVTLKRRWFQISLKGMLVTMTLACVGLGWVAYERNKERKREAAIAAIEDLGGKVDDGGARPIRPQWLRPLLGETSTHKVGMVHLDRTKVTDGGLVHLKCLTELIGLYLSDTEVTDTGLVHLKGLTKLEWINLEDTKVTDAGLVHLKGLTELKFLYFNGTEITDAGLVHLKGLTKLEFLDLNGTQVTEQGFRELQDALPNLEIAR